jgi:hypothetical protein
LKSTTNLLVDTILVDHQWQALEGVFGSWRILWDRSKAFLTGTKCVAISETMVK